MSVQEIIDQIRALPPDERAEISRFIREEDDSIVPESFKAGMKAALDGRFVDMEVALNEMPPPHLR